MQRLLLGEVGSGKTVVARVGAAAGRRARPAGRADGARPRRSPSSTSRRCRQLLGGEQANVTCALLTGSTPARRRADTLGKLASGELSLIVGTHALIEPDVEFARARGRGGGRAAPLRRAPAGGAGREGRWGRERRPEGAARAAHDGDADPAHARARQLRRSGHDDAARAAPGQAADRDADRRRRGRARARVRASCASSCGRAGRRMSCAR